MIVFIFVCHCGIRANLSVLFSRIPPSSEVTNVLEDTDPDEDFGFRKVFVFPSEMMDLSC